MLWWMQDFLHAWTTVGKRSLLHFVYCISVLHISRSSDFFGSVSFSQDTTLVVDYIAATESSSMSTRSSSSSCSSCYCCLRVHCIFRTSWVCLVVFFSFCVLEQWTDRHTGTIYIHRPTKIGTKQKKQKKQK